MTTNPDTNLNISEQPGNSGENVGQPPNKRRRIALACNACRTRKSRCDGTRPQCSCCRDLGFDCVYVQSSSSTNVIVGKEYLSSLETRVQHIEETLETFRDSITKLTDFVSSRNATSGSTSRDESVGAEQLQEPNEDSVDAMGAVVFANEEECGFFGPSSNIAFLRHISRAVAHASNTDQPWTPLTAPDSGHFDGGFLSISRPSSPTRQVAPEERVNIYALPKDAETLRLINKYFSDTGFLYPFLHEETFLQTYFQMKNEPQAKVRKTWLGLLNMVLALATSTTVASGMKAETRIAESDIFYQRAVGLCHRKILRGTSLEIVQYLLLMGLYLQGTQKSIQAWTIHGLAVKAAFQLGLHSSDASRVFPPLEKEIRKRTWFGCVVLDRTLSMTFGRPAAIPDNYVRLELPSSFPDVSPSTPESRNPDSVEFFVATVKLYKVLWHVVDSLYGQNIGCDRQPSIGETVARLFNIEHELLAWERSLPTSLRIRTFEASTKEPDEAISTPQTFAESRLATILTLRYLNLRLLLHRPILVRFLDLVSSTDFDTQELSLLQQIGSNSIYVCFHSATEIISIVNAAVHATGLQRGLLGAWWFSLYYTFNAALVVFACLLVCQAGNTAVPPVSVSTFTAKESLAKAIEALGNLDHGNHMVERCRHYLNQLAVVLESIVIEDGECGERPPPQPSYGDGTQHPPVAPRAVVDQSPLAMDFGEFMMESDLNFLNHYFPPDLPGGGMYGAPTVG